MVVSATAALGAAFCWALGGMIAVEPARALGALAFGRLRMALVFLMVAALATVTGGWASLSDAYALPLIVSGLVGIMAGDTALFACLRRLGPRRTGVIFATNAPMTVALGAWLLGEPLSSQRLAGFGLITGGVVLAVLFGKGRKSLHDWESVRGPLWQGVLLGLAAALAQAGGVLLVKPVMAAGVDPFAAAAVRVGVAVTGLLLMALLPLAMVRAQAPLSWPMVVRTGLSGLTGMTIGMTLLLWALETGDAGLVATLAGTTPVLILPLLWWRTRERPGLGAWVGAALVVTGTALLFL
ncbi:DMT family transporter [Caenispirillum bisanense]|uniref:Uncharacterized membrane protein n=1 Tax=Caenispirillum bisanense TaxID=414052 RepID=A0A286GLQ8_9PROT|nr:DMT family transporter [Caenispirillum bisanense]SOD96467.1 Uncharacterized membrane protein [Caenispirillum bisanense]